MTDWWQSAFKTWEIAFAAPQIIAHRTQRLAAAGHLPDARDQKEFLRMGQEKLEAFGESWLAMAAEMAKFNLRFAATVMQQSFGVWSAFLPFVTAGSTQRLLNTQASLLRSTVLAANNKELSNSLSRVVTKGVHPVHKRATANVKRLRRKR
ncbi:MAG: polyhydroxyalkanoate granule-associated phasin [Burkholderiales bacterium]